MLTWPSSVSGSFYLEKQASGLMACSLPVLALEPCYSEYRKEQDSRHRQKLCSNAGSGPTAELQRPNVHFNKISL